MMSSICSKKAVDDVVLYDPTIQTRYSNLKKWAESDAEFVKRVTNGVHNLPHPTVVDSISCRQMYLRSYAFSKKKESMPEKTKKCFTKFKQQVVKSYSKKIKNIKGDEEMKKIKRLTSALAALSMFRYFTKRVVVEKKMMKKEEGVKRRRVTTGRLRGGGFCLRRVSCLRRIREVSCGVLLSLFRKVLYCTTKVDVVI